MAKLEALLFDVDGTLADTERDGHRVAFNETFKQQGLDWHWSVELYGKLLAVTGGKERILYYLNEFNKEFKRPANLHDFIAGLHQAKTLIYTGMLVQGAIPLRPGVLRLIQEAREGGYRLAIATTTTPANVLALLHHTLGKDAHTWFDIIAAGDVVPAKKPAPDIYLYAMEKLQLGPHQCIAFEDSANGVLSSKGAGLKTIVTVNAYTRDDDFNGAEVVLDQLGEPGQGVTLLSGAPGPAEYVDMAFVEQVFRS